MMCPFSVVSCVCALRQHHLHSASGVGVRALLSAGHAKLPFPDRARLSMRGGGAFVVRQTACISGSKKAQWNDKEMPRGGLGYEKEKKSGRFTTSIEGKRESVT